MQKNPYESEKDAMKAAQTPMICCDGLVKIYSLDDLKVMALQGLDLEVQSGEMMTIIGKSGSGKSTLLNMIGGLETPTAGRLCINGRDLSGYTQKELTDYRRSRIGFVWQNSAKNLLPYLTVMDNVMFPMRILGKKKTSSECRRRAHALLEAVGMEAHFRKFPVQLSGGEQQRAAIAVALANKPSILLADEPTGSVDSKTSEQIFMLFQKLNVEQNLTILMVTHDIRIAGWTDRVVEICDGKISTEKIRRDAVQNHGFPVCFKQDMEASHVEYSVLDKARRLQLTESVLEQAGITSNKVRVEVADKKVIISQKDA